MTNVWACFSRLSEFGEAPVIMLVFSEGPSPTVPTDQKDPTDRSCSRSTKYQRAHRW